MAKKNKGGKKNKEMTPLIIGKVAKALKESAEFRLHLNSGYVQMANGDVVRANLDNYKLNCRRITAHPSGVVVFKGKDEPKK